MRRKKIIELLTIALVLVIASYSMFGTIMKNQSVVYVCIDQDDNCDSVVNKIHEVAHPTTMLGFKALVTLTHSKIRTGRYTINPDMSMLRLFKNIRGHIQDPVRVIVPVTRTMGQLEKQLSQVLMPDSAAFAAAFADTTRIQNSVGTSFKQASIPAAIIPDTYEFYWDNEANVVVNRLLKNYNKFWDNTRMRKARLLQLTPVEVATLASIVDAESDYVPEKPRIAGLYLNRLHQGLPLQSDPTVIFAIGDFTIHRVSHAQTHFDSPYNTYLYKGLPPGPIRIPSKAGIDAVLNAERHNYLYMCAKEDFSGSHNFSSSYTEHLQNAARYAKALNEHGILK